MTLSSAQQNSDSAARSTDPLLQPFKLKALTLRNRVMSTSHACGLEEAGMPVERYQRYHEEKAKGGLALTMFGGSSNVAPDSPSIFRQLNVGEDRIIRYFQEFSERIHRYGTALMCQITHLGRRGDPYAGNWLPTIGPSPVRETLHRSFPKEMDDHDIDRVVKAFGAAAYRCKEGGLDGIETIAASHLIGQFLSPLTNQRSDGFGGSLENRCRFALLVHQEIRRRVGDDFIVGMRFVVDEGENGGLSFDDCVAAAKLLQAEGAVDFFNALFGRMDTERALARDNMPGMDSPIAPWVSQVGAFKREVSIPVFHAARVSDVASARYAIGEGLLDMVGMTRAHIADPYIVAKLEQGREAEIRPCVGATHCQSIYRPSCLHNPASGREGDLPHVIGRSPSIPKRVFVVGGGPAGLEAARVSAERGHQVVLCEAGPELGGQVLIGASGAWRKDLIGIVSWRIAELERLRVPIHLNRYVDVADVASENPDLVIIATGGIPDLDWLEGSDLCTSAWDLLTGNAPIRENVLIYDGTGRHPALLAAEKVASAGRSVTLATIDGYIAAELTYAERVAWKRHLYKPKIPILVDHSLVSVRRDGIRLAAMLVNELTLTEATIMIDQVVVEHGTIPCDDLYRSLRPLSSNDGVTDIAALLAGARQPKAQHSNATFELHRIGDAVASRNVHSAILDALRLCSAF